MVCPSVARAVLCKQTGVNFRGLLPVQRAHAESHCFFCADSSGRGYLLRKSAETREATARSCLPWSDIIRAAKDLNRKANFLFCVFRAADPFVKNFLFKSYCLSLYGCSLWSLSSSSIKLIEVTLNKLLDKLWCFPLISHSSIVHCVAQIDTVSDIVFSRFLSLLSSSLTSSSSLVQSVFSVSSQLMYSFSGYNNIFGSKHLIDYSSTDFCIADIVRKVRHLYGFSSPCEGLICYVTCS